jgi:hypothetical protein
MSDQDVINKAQENVDFIVRQLSGFKVPAFRGSAKFLESVLNHNGFSNVKIEFDVTNMYKPTVKQALPTTVLFEGEAK